MTMVGLIAGFVRVPLWVVGCCFGSQSSLGGSSVVAVEAGKETLTRISLQNQ